MTREEFAQLSDYATRLWPAFEPTVEQAEIWYDDLRRFDYHTARQALGAAYSTTKWKIPTIPDIREAIKKLLRGRMGETDVDFPPEFVAQVKDEEAEEAMHLSDWTREDFENGKKEIMLREPGMDRFEKLKANGKMWRHFLCERYVHYRITLFPGVVRVEKRRKPTDVIHRPSPVQMSRDAWWDQCAPLMLELDARKNRPRDISNATPARLLDQVAV